MLCGSTARPILPTPGARRNKHYCVYVLTIPKQKGWSRDSKPAADSRGFRFSTIADQDLNVRADLAGFQGVSGKMTRATSFLSEGPIFLKAAFAVEQAMGGIFISYRRGDSAGYAGRLSDHLRDHFGKDKVFIDVETIEFGTDFVEALHKAISSCSVLLVLIGPMWLTMTDAAGRRRLDDPDDFTMLEISAALERNIRVIPVLVQDAKMPVEEDIPDSLKALTRRQAIGISNERWDFDVNRLIGVLEKDLGLAPQIKTNAKEHKEPAEQGKTAGISSGLKSSLIAASLLVAAVSTYLVLHSNPAPRTEPAEQIPQESSIPTKPTPLASPVARLPKQPRKRADLPASPAPTSYTPVHPASEAPKPLPVEVSPKPEQEKRGELTAEKSAPQDKAVNAPIYDNPTTSAKTKLYSINTSQDRSTVSIINAKGEETDHISLDPDRIQGTYTAPDGKWSLVVFKTQNQPQYGALPIDLTKGKPRDTVEIPFFPETVTFENDQAVLTFHGQTQRIALH